MQNDAISKSEVLKVMENDLLLHESEVEIVEEICTRVRALPALDVAPVVHARWIDPCINKYGHPCHHCSACRFKASQKDRNFCPNCGARMDGEAE